MYNLAIFTNSFLYPSIEVSTVVMGIIVANIIACKGGDGGLSSEVS